MREFVKIIDFHSHILPCADHGSDGIETSKGQVALMNNAGVHTAVLTPHFYPERHRVARFIDEINASAEELISSCDARPKFCLGAEVLYCDGIENMEDLEKLCIRGTRILLLELPMRAEWNKTMLYAIKRIAANYTIVLAHVDRYVRTHGNELSNLLSTEGIYAQINAYSLSRFSVRRALKPYLEAGYVWAIGSDLHGIDKNTYRQFKKAKKRLGEDGYSKIMTRTEELLRDATLY